MGWAGFDFLLGAEGYKSSWCNNLVEAVNIHAGFHQWAPAYFWFSRGKPFVRGNSSRPAFAPRHGCKGQASSACSYRCTHTQYQPNTCPLRAESRPPII
jgi:hypothetical protein